MNEWMNSLIDPKLLEQRTNKNIAFKLAKI